MQVYFFLKDDEIIVSFDFKAISSSLSLGLYLYQIFLLLFE